MLPKEGDRFARRYRIDRILGRGAMGVVFEATHETLGQRVAIKVLRSDDDERATKRFVREAKLAARLGSPHVVKVLDVDHTEDDVPYIVMERLEGRDLAAEVEARGSIPADESIGWMIAVCDAMVEAHAAGVIHRDLKLSNVFLCKDGTVKVLDFGVAALGSGEVESSTVTNVAGTTRYMAPEQLLGEAPDPKSDVWAVGVMAYRLVAGRFPYEAPTAAAQMLAIMEGCPPIASIVPDIEPALATAIHGALGRTLEERCPSMDDLRAGLEATRVRAKPRPDEPSNSAPRSVASDRPSADPSKSRAAKLVVVAAGVGLALVIGRDLLRRRDEAIDAQRGREAVVVSPSASASANPSMPSASASVVASSVASAAPAASSATAIAPTSSVPSAASGRPPTTTSASASPTAKPSATSGDGFPSHL